MSDEQVKHHNAPCSNRDYDAFYQGLEDQRIVIQKCGNCDTLRHPPEPMCPHCHSLDWSGEALSGKGTIYSFIIHHHPPLPGYEMPHPVGLVELEEGVRVVAGLDGMPLDEIAIGLPVKAEFLRRGDVASLRFSRA